MSNAALDSLAYTNALYERVTPALAYPGGGRDRVASWKVTARAKLTELLGITPSEMVPLQAEIGCPVEKTGYTRRAVTYNTRPGLTAFGYLLVPNGLKGRAPAIVCIPGHGRGVDDLVGITEDGSERDRKDGYQHDFAIQCVERGFVTMAIEPIGFGHRRDPAARKAGPDASSCQPAAGAALMLGETMLGWRVWDAIRTLDFLETRPEVDPGRMAMIGISGGGTVALDAAALDERIKATVLSCSFCSFRDSIYTISHCIDNYVPGILRWFEVADIAGLIAPRALFAENGVLDPIFPESGVRAALKETERIYADQGVVGRVDHHLFEGGHVFNGIQAFPRLAEWLDA
jgi:dienelactone hydrolase